jgi:hypothetical protein
MTNELVFYKNLASYANLKLAKKTKTIKGKSFYAYKNNNKA